MFNFQGWITKFKDHYQEHGTIYNDAASYGVTTASSDNFLWRVLGIHHLTPDENRGNHNVYIEVLCKQGDREAFKAIHWTWEGKRPDQNAPDVFAGQKSLNELVNIPINLGQIVSIWPHLGEMASGFSSNHPDESGGNTIGHHSFFVCFQEIEGNGQLPKPEPEPIETNASIHVTANLEWLNTLPINNEGNITFTVNGE